jgi:hypothetical protein
VELARFLAEVSLSAATPKNRVVKVLDPACGDGSLLRAVVDMADPSLRSRLFLTGFETDSVALEQASENLQDPAIQGVRLEHQDFLLSEETGSLRLGPIFERSTGSTTMATTRRRISASFIARARDGTESTSLLFPKDVVDDRQECVNDR